MLLKDLIQQARQTCSDFFEVEEDGRLTLRPGPDAGYGALPPFTLIPIAAGAFVMGDGADTDNPAHPVSLSSFFMGQTPVTQELYRAVTGENPSRFEGKKRPVERVSWEDAVAFCNRLNELLGLPPSCEEEHPYRLLTPEGRPTSDPSRIKGFRLPTEAEWEYAAIGGHLAPKGADGMHRAEFPYAGSGDLDAVGWYDKNSGSETRPVGLKFPNPLGLYDLSGNVWEWCWDWYGRNYYEQCRREGVVHNPQGPSEGSGRVCRGGSWSFNAGDCRASYRPEDAPGDRNFNLGFRLVLVL